MQILYREVETDLDLYINFKADISQHFKVKDNREK